MELRGLAVSKSTACFNFLTKCRNALDEVSGAHRRLEPQIMPPPLQLNSGFPLGRLAGFADALGVKLYTIHWPMIARYWARDLVGRVTGAQADSVSVAIGQLFGFLDTYPNDAQAYPRNVSEPLLYPVHRRFRYRPTVVICCPFPPCIAPAWPLIRKSTIKQ